jgi:uncharacterized protein YndB with AHSA1/START domain
MINTDAKISHSTVIKADPQEIWDVLINPVKIKMYIGSDTITDWKVGSDIRWRGEFGDMKYEDKGKVLENNPGAVLKFEYWSSFGGSEDIPENYSTITYTLDKLSDAQTKLTYTRENIPSQQEMEMFQEHLPSMLEAIKELAEQK